MMSKSSIKSGYSRYQMTEKDARNHMQRTLMEWGVRPGKDETHTRFYQKALSFGVTYCTDTSPNRNKASKEHLEKLPPDEMDAVRYVLEDVVDDDNDYWDAVDTSDGPLWPPYFQQKDRETGEIVYRLDRAYSGFKLQQFDPFHRFEGKKYSAAEWFYEIFNNLASLDGYIFEAMTALYLQNNMACQSCKFRNCLRWDGGYSTAWADVVCVQCQASYEIKTKASDDAVEKAFGYNNIRGGSVRVFYKNSKGDSRIRYLVVVSRGATMERSTSVVSHRVSLGEIKTVVPKLCPESFIDIPGAKYMRMLSEVSVDVHSLKKAWCRLASFDVPKAREIARQVYEDRFGADTWKRFSKASSESSDEDGPQQSDEIKGPEQTDKDSDATAIDALRASIDQMKIGDDDDDDWEAYAERCCNKK